MNNFDTLIESILSNKVFDNMPPVLIDIGASGEIFHKWSLIAKKSICIAFDADDRDFSYDAVEGKSGYLKMYKFNRIVLPVEQKECTFYLTTSPYCSSTLKPDAEALKEWMFAPLFHVEKEVRLQTVTIKECLENIKLDYIDWYKVDSQGIDMDLFLSIPEPIRKNILAADFEPGIMDAYLNENKLAELLVLLDKESYWISSFDVRGTQRLDQKYFSFAPYLHESPCWAGITTLQNIRQGTNLRSALLLIIFSLIEQQWGYAIQICEKLGKTNPLFGEIHKTIINYIAQQEKISQQVIFPKFIRRVKNMVKKVIGRR